MLAPSDADFLVMTQNAWGGAPLWRRREERLARILAERSPAVLGMQEIRAASASGLESQAHSLARRASGYTPFFWPSHLGNDGACEGVALLCRDDLELLDHATERLSLDPDDALDRVTQRIVARTSLRFRGVVIDVFVTHLPISKRARARTVHEVLTFAEEGRKASGSQGAVLMGDFNATPREEPIRALEATWTDAWSAVHPGELGATWPSVAPVTRIDYVFAQLGAGWEIVEAARAPFAGSDHAGVLATIRLPPRG